MATHLRTKSFQRNLFLSVGGLFLLFAICFSLYQYKRERQFKTDILDAQLQAYCYEMMQSLGRDSILNPRSFNLYVSSHHVEGLRITIVNLKGEVLLDSSEDYHKIKENHSSRKEIADALKSGKGYDIKRTSSSTHKTYFYTAVRLGDIIVRAAVPYSAELTQSLRADNTYLYFAITLTLLLGIVLYLNTSRIGKHIEYLREFAQKAERGEKLDHELERQLPDDELGDISHTIISLYWKLHHSMEDKARLKRQLTQNVAHELKTPAASIQGYLESILENPDMPEEKKQHFLRHCYAQSMRMSKLLLDMSTLTKLEESPTLSLDQSEVINVLELIHSVISDVSLDLERQGIIVELNVEDSVKVKADRTALYSVFRNIIDNSIAYASASKITISCKEHEQKNHHYYEFKVSDNGIGIDPKHLPHIFERFYRIDKGRSRKAGGTGLGLAIVKNAITSHKGEITAETTPGGGLTIRFTLNSIDNL